ncbi:MAG: hypothetical protein RIT03_789 [Bacteroidota bacterium]|jgi:uncharacterized protein YbbC (DUF1343 family)
MQATLTTPVAKPYKIRRSIRYYQLICCLLLLLPLSVFAVVSTGIEELREQKFKLLEGKRIGLITNPTAVDRNLKPTIDILFEAKNIQLVALFGPEHGVRGNVYAGDHVKNVTDPKTGLPVFSLYGKTAKPTSAMLEGIDVLVYDIQDNGCRSYTYISTMGLAMEAAAEHHIEFVVLDRPNPLGGLKIEGNSTEDPFVSFVSQYKIPYLYGLTCGELALMLNEEQLLKAKCKLTVVKMDGWKRAMTWKDTDLEWVVASPHIANMQSSTFYPITGILGELNYVSIGVGYTLPFEIVGAPWINAEQLTAELNKLNLKGIKFRPIHFKPFYATFKDVNCHGVQIYVRDYKKANLTEIQFYIMQELNQLYPNRAVFNHADASRFAMFDKVCGSDKIRLNFSKRHLFEDIKEYWYKDVEDYREVAKKYYLYK